MAVGRSINYQINFNANTQQAKAQIDSLFASVNKLASQPTQIVNVSSLKEGVRTAQQLQAILQKSVDTTTGDLNLSQFSTQMKNAGLTVTQLASKLNALGPEGAQAFGQLTTAVANAQISVKRTTTLFDSFLATLKRTAQYQLSTTMLNAFVGSIHSAISYVKNLDEALTNISVVTGMSDAKLANFASRAQALGKELKASTLDVANAALIYFQQGDSMAAAMEKATITMKAANVSFNSSAKQMSEYLTAVWNSYQVGADQLEHYVDIMAALGSKTATSMEEIAAAMQKVAATANTVGVSFDQMSSIISTVSSVTREAPESIGTAFKTILARMGDLKVGSLTEDGITVTLGTVSSQLKQIGVNILGANGEMRDMGTIIEEIGTKWQGFNSAQKAALAQAIAGKRQYTQMMALFENFGDYQNNMKIAEDSDGTLENMQNRWATSWEAAANRVQNAMQGIWSSLINNKAVTASLNVIADITNGIGTLIEKMGGIVPVIAMIGGAFGTQLGGKASKAITSVKDRIASLFGKETSSAKKTRQEFLDQYEKGNMTGTQLQHAKKNLALSQRYYGMKDRLTQEQRDKWDATTKRLQEAQARETAAEAGKKAARDKRLFGEQKLNNITDLSTSEAQKNLDKIRKNYEKKRADRAKDRGDFDYKKQLKELQDQRDSEQKKANGQYKSLIDESNKQLNSLQGKLGGHTTASNNYDNQLKEIAKEKTNKHLTRNERAQLTAQEETLNQKKKDQDQIIADVQAQIEKERKIRDKNQAELDKPEQNYAKEKEKLDARKAQNDKIDEKDKEKYEQQKKEQKEAMLEDLAKVGISEKTLSRKNDKNHSLVEAYFSEDKEEAKKAGEEVAQTYKEAVAKGISNKSKNMTTLNKGKKLSELFAGGNKSDQAKKEIAQDTTELLTNLNETDGDTEYNQKILSKIQDQVKDNEKLKNMITTSTGENGQQTLTFNVEFQVDEENLGEVLDVLNTATDQYDNKIDEQQRNQIELGDQYLGEHGSEGIKQQIEGQQEEDIHQEEIEQAQEDQKKDEEDLGDIAPEVKATEAFISLGAAAASAYSGIQSVISAFSALSDPDLSPLEKATALITGLSGAIISFTSVGQSMNTVMTWAASAAKAHAAAAMIEAGATEGQTAAQLKNTAVTELNTKIKNKLNHTQGGLLAKTLAYITALWSEQPAVEADGVSAEAAAAANKALAAAKLKVIGIAALFVVALVGAAIAINNFIQSQQEVKPTLEEVQDAISNSSSSIRELKTNLQQLSAIMNDTSLSYDEQIEKINEITEAYGVQASALAVLSGNYANFKRQISEQAVQQSQINAQEAKSAWNLVKDFLDLTDWWGDNFKGRVKSGNSDLTTHIQTYDPITDSYDIFNANNGWYGLESFMPNKDTYRASLYNESTWKALNENWTADGNTKGFYTEYFNDVSRDSKKTQLFSREGKLWKNSDFIKALNDHNFAISSDFQFGVSNKVTAEDLAWLGKVLTGKEAGYEDFANFTQQEGSYSNLIWHILENKNVSQVISALENLNTSQLESQIYSYFDKNRIDFLNIDGLESDLTSTLGIISGIIRDNSLDWEDSFLSILNFLSGFSSEFGTATTKIQALYELATQTAAFYGKDVQDVWDKFVTSKLSTLDADAIIKIHPTEIQMDKKGNYLISDAVESYVQNAVKSETANNKRGKIKENKSVLTGNDLTADNLSSLQSQDFLTDENIELLKRSGSATRTTLYNSWYEQFIRDTIDADQEQLDNLPTLMKEAEQKREEGYKDLQKRAQETEYSGLAFDHRLTGEMLYQDIYSQQDKVRKENSLINQILADNESMEPSVFIETYGKILKDQYGWNEDDEEHTLSKTITQLKTKQINTSETLSLYNELLNPITLLNDSLLDYAQQQKDLPKELENLSYELDTTILRSKYANTASKWSSAISKQGDLDAETLAVLQSSNENALNQYQTLSSSEWNKYVYEQAQSQYDLLLELYDKDSAEYAAILDEKKNLTENYYKTLQDAAKQAAEVQEKEWDKIIKGAESAMSAASSMSSGKVTFESLENLRAGLDAAGVSAERIEEIINRIYNAKGDKEQIRASMVAEAEAALAKLSAESAEVQEYKGLVTELDTSLVDGTEINIKAEVENSQDVTNEVSTAVKSADSSVHVEAETDDVSDQIRRAVKAAPGEKVITMSDGSTITGQVKEAIENADGSVVVTLDNDSQVELGKGVRGAITYGTNNGNITLKLANGRSFSGQITSVLRNPDDPQRYTLQLANGSDFETDVDAAFGVNESGQRVIKIEKDGESFEVLADNVAGIFAPKNKDGKDGWTIKFKDGTLAQLTTDLQNALSPGNSKDSYPIDVKINLIRDQLDELMTELSKQQELNYTVKVDTTQMRNSAYLETVMKSMNSGDLREYIKLTNKGYDKKLLNTDNNGLFHIYGGYGDYYLGTHQRAALTYLSTKLAGDRETLRSSYDETTGKLQQNSYADSMIRQLVAILGKNSHYSGETQQVALMLLQGLAAGIQEAIPGFDWSGYVQGLGVTIDDAFKSELLIFSPSRLTKALAPYLFEGLAVGIKEANEAFEVPELTGLAEKIAKGFEAEIGKVDFSKGLDELLNDNGLKEKFNQAGFTDEDFTTYVAGGYATYDEEAFKNSDFFKQEVNKRLAQKHQVLDRSPQLGKSLRLNWNKFSKIVADYSVPEISAEEIKATEEEVLQDYQDKLLTLLQAQTDSWFSDTKWNSSSELSNFQKNVMNDAMEATLKKYNATRYEDISPEEQDAFIEDFYKNIEAGAKEALNAVKKTWASIKDTWLNGLKELYTADEETARKTYTLWENTFKAIATARQSILEGKTPIEGMFGDTNALSAIVESYLNAGKKIEDIRDILTGNDVTQLIFEPFDFENYRNSGNQRYLNIDKEGTQFIDTSVEDYNKNVNKEVQAWMNSDSRNAFMAEVLTPDKLMSLASGTTEEQEMLEELITTGVVNKTKGKDGAADSYSFNKSTQATVSKEIVDMLAKSLYLSTQKEVNNVLSTAWTEIASQRYNIADSGRTTAETAIAKQQGDLEAVQKAKELKLQGKDLDSLTYDEKQAVLRLTGAQDLASVSLDSLNSAASKCANMIANLADTMAQAMYLIQNGQADTFEIGEDGTVTAYKQVKGKYDTLEKSMASRGFYYDKDADAYLTAEGLEASEQIIEQAKKDLTHLELVPLTGDKANVTGSTVDSGQKAVEDLKRTARDSAASLAGMSTEEFDDYAARLYEVLDTTGTAFSELTDIETQAFYNLTAKIKLAEDGFSALQATSKDTWKILNKQTKVSTSEYSKTLSAMKSNMSKIFGVDLKKLTNKFVEDHLDELHKMATGTEKEAIAAQDAIQDDLVAAFMETEGLDATVTINVDGVPTAINILDLFQNQLDQWDGKDIGFTITPDMTPAIDSMNSLIQAGTMASTQISEALGDIGWQPQIEWQKVEMVSETATNGLVTVQDDKGKTYTVQSTDIMKNDMGVFIPVIGSAKKITPPGGGPRPNPSGGGGSKAKKLDKKDPEDEIERYHHVNKTLDRLSNQLDEVDKKKSRIYGKSYLDYISQEIALTEKQCDTYQRYIDEAKEYLKLDTERVVSLGAIFDEYGNIANYDQVMQNILDAYNAFIDEYNAMDADTQQSEEVEQRKEDWDKWYDEKKKWIENYEETVQTIYEQNNNLLEAQNKISEKMLEGIQYKVEIHVELTDAEKEYLDYVNDKYEEILMKQGEVMSNLVKETDLTVSNLAALGKEKEELDAAFASGKLNQADYVDGLKDLNSQVLDNLSTLQELKTSIEEFYGDTLETATNDFDKQTAKVKAASEAMSSYISILALVGKGSNLKELTKFYDSQYQYNLQSLQMQQEYLNTLKKEEEYYLERMNSAEGLTETERKQYEALEETLNNVQSNILSDTQSTLQAIAEAFNNEVEIIISDLEKMIAGSDNSLQDLADAYSYYQEEQERYVTSARELYEVNKLNRSIEKTMATTTSTVNKNLLAALQERINKQSEENELTEYNVEMNQLQYELLLKKIALEEAQNAKNTVRLTRDAGGNYVYQYTANQEDILSKEQEYEDVLQQINDLSVNRVRDLESQLLQIYQNTTQKMREIAEDQTLTEEEKYAKIQTLMDQFKEQTNYIQEQYNIASAHLIKSNEVISEHYNKALVEHSQNAQNGLNQTIAKMIENTQQFQQAMEDACTNKIPSAMDQMKERIDSVTDTTNTSYGSMADSLGNYNKVAEDAVDQNNKIADGLENEVLPAIHNITTAWDEYAAKLKEVINVYEEMYQTIVRTLQAQGKLSNAEELKSQVQNQGNSSPSGGLTTGTPGVNPPKQSEENQANDSGNKTGKDSKHGYKVTGKYLGDVKEGYDFPAKNGDLATAKTTAENCLAGLTKAGWTDLVIKAYATGGIADFTGPAWLDGTKSKPELVLNSGDTQNLLAAVESVRKLDSSTLRLLNNYIANASLAMTFGLSTMSAQSVFGGADSLRQDVHITAEFPNATNSQEIEDAFDSLINRAAQFITTKS